MKNLLTVEQAAQLMQINPQTLNNWRSKGKGIPYVKIGRSVRYKISVIEKWVNEREIIPDLQ